MASPAGGPTPAVPYLDADIRRRRRQVLMHCAMPGEVVGELLGNKDDASALCHNRHLPLDAWTTLFADAVDNDKLVRSTDALLRRPLPDTWVAAALTTLMRHMPLSYRAIATAAVLVTHHRLTDDQWDALGEKLADAAYVAPDTATWPELWVSSPEVPDRVRRRVATRCALKVRVAFVAECPSNDADDAELLLGEYPEFSVRDLEKLSVLCTARPGLGEALAAAIVDRRPLRSFTTGPALVAIGAWTHSPELCAETVRTTSVSYSGRAHDTYDVSFDDLLVQLLWDTTMPAELVEVILERIDRNRPFSYRSAKQPDPATVTAAEIPIQVIGRMWRAAWLTDADRAELVSRTRSANRHDLAALLQHDLDGSSPWWEGIESVVFAGVAPDFAVDAAATTGARLGDDPWAWRLALDLLEGGSLDWDDAVASVTTAFAA